MTVPAPSHQRKKAIFGLDKIGACRSLSDFNDQTVSVDLAPNYCVRLFGSVCDDRGHAIIDLAPDSSERLDISPYGFTGGEGASAIERIKCPIDSDVPILYTGTNQNGRSQPVYGLDNPGDCVLLPQFNDLANSLTVPENKCLHLFGGSCDDFNFAQVQVTSRTKVNNNLASAGLSGGSGLSAVKLIECKPEPVGTLYSETNQNGAPKALDQLKKIGDCQTLSDFNDRTKSASVRPGSCLRFFGGACDDYNQVTLDVDSTSSELDDLGPSGFVGGEGISAVKLIECPEGETPPPPPPAPVAQTPSPPATGVNLFAQKNYGGGESYIPNFPVDQCMDIGTRYSSLQAASDVCVTLQENSCSASDPGRTMDGSAWQTDFGKAGFSGSSLRFWPCSGSANGSPSFTPVLINVGYTYHVV